MNLCSRNRLQTKHSYVTNPLTIHGQESPLSEKVNFEKNSTIKHKITFYNVFISWYMYTFMLFVILGCMYESKRSRKKPQTVGVISSANLKIDHLLYSGSFRTITVHVCCCAISWLLWKSENKVFPIAYLCCLLIIHNLYPLQKHYLWENVAIKKSYFTQNTEMFW